MAASFVQAAKNVFTSSSSTLTATFSSGTTAGSFVVVAGMFDIAATGVTVTNFSNSGDSISNLISVFDDTGRTGTKTFAAACYAPTTGSTQFRATFSGTTPGYGDMFIWEFAGLTNPTSDKIIGPTQGVDPALAASGTSGTLTAADEAAIAYFASGAHFNAGEQGSGWSVVAGDGDFAATTGSFGEHRTVAATTAINGNLTGTGAGFWVALLATFMAGAGGPTTLDAAAGSYAVTGSAASDKFTLTADGA